MASIILDNVSLNYPIYDARNRSIKNMVYSSVGGKMLSDNDRIEVQALCGLTLSLHDGDRLAIVGKNGAGKTTLLKVLAGIYEPPIGYLNIEGTVSSLTDVTMGMDLDATGRENIIMRCIFLGMTYKEINSKLVDIEDFTELGSYLSLPIRTYSTGMLVRLGFAASTACRPQILIMDEIIGAGDFSFAEKAKKRVQEYISDAHILVLASHNRAILEQFCNKAILLDAGRIVKYGSLETVLEAYDKPSVNSEREPIFE